MEQRFDIGKLTPNGYKAMFGVHSYVQGCGLDLGLLEVVHLRVSQINGCAFCLNMHVPLAREHGISADQVNMVAAWREAPVFDVRMRVALAWAEAVTYLRDGSVPDEVYAQASAQFSPLELSNLTFAVAEINSWNRLMVASRTPPQIAAA